MFQPDSHILLLPTVLADSSEGDKIRSFSPFDNSVDLIYSQTDAFLNTDFVEASIH